MQHISELFSDSQSEYRVTIGIGLRGNVSRFLPGMQGGCYCRLLIVECRFLDEDTAGGGETEDEKRSQMKSVVVEFKFAGDGK
jgi:hypothetical protein